MQIMCYVLVEYSITPYIRLSLHNSAAIPGLEGHLCEVPEHHRLLQSDEGTDGGFQEVNLNSQQLVVF